MLVYVYTKLVVGELCHLLGQQILEALLPAQDFLSQLDCLKADIDYYCALSDDATAGVGRLDAPSSVNWKRHIAYLSHSQPLRPALFRLRSDKLVVSSKPITAHS